MWPVLIGIVKPYSLTHSTLGLHLFACFAQDRPFTLCMESRPYYIQWDKKFNQVQGQSNELVRCVQHMFLLCSCVVKSNISVVVLSFWLWRFPLMPLLFYTVIHGRVPSSAKITAESKVNQYSSITCRTFAWNSCRRKHWKFCAVLFKWQKLFNNSNNTNDRRAYYCHFCSGIICLRIQAFLFGAIARTFHFIDANA